MRKRTIDYFLTNPLLILLVLLPFDGKAQNTLDIESGLVFSGYNDIAIPNRQNNKFSLDDLGSKATPFFRLRYLKEIDNKHGFGVLIAPLTIKYVGAFNQDVNFRGNRYKAGGKVKATYKFNSYRLIYRYKVYEGEKSSLKFGGALKIRDAEINLNNQLNNNSKTNLGFVPLLSFNYTYQFLDGVDGVIDGEALIAPQGRAEDIFVGLNYKLGKNFKVKSGYRFLEGGADNDKLYTFSMFNYAALGLIWSF